MVLNIFPKKKEPAVPAPTPEPELRLPEPTPDLGETAGMSEPGDEQRKRARRGSRGGRGRGGRAPVEAQPGEDGVEAPTAEETVAPPRRAPRPRRAPAPAEPISEEVAGLPAEEPAVEAAPAEPRPTRRRGRAGAETAAAAPAPGDSSESGILRALDQQNRQIEQLIRMQEDAARRFGGGHVSAAPPARVGVFVDAANIELACDRLRSRIDWAKVLKLLTQDRQLVRAMAYSPVHDDPGVSIETQRFVEPFLDKGYKVVTKALKRFQDGTIKANVDIELALDVITMLDRLDVVCLVSGDGDFQRLVEVVQSRGVRVEVVAMGSSTAANLRHAADAYIDLQARIRDVRA
jgi:uncharacterized LabA/DUF88 family protein